MRVSLLLLCGRLAHARGALTAQLSHGGYLPLVGLGVGNLQPELVPAVVERAVRELGVRHIDTAAASRNERAISLAVERAGVPDGAVSIQTKVWYTHLGYNRTMLSVRDSLAQLGARAARNATVLIHWPRCRRDIPWMACEREEAELPPRVRAAGPAPHLDPDGAWLESWRALEDLHAAGELATIGVSNCDVADLRALAARARALPHVLQGNVWSFVFDPQLVRWLREHRVTFQAYNVMNGVLGQRRRAPAAHRALEALGARLGGASASAVVLRWLAGEGVGAIPRASRDAHLADNAPASVAAVPALSEAQRAEVRGAVASLLRGEGGGEDAPADEDAQRQQEQGVQQGVHVTFVNRRDAPARVYWIHSDTGEEIPATETIPAGGSASVQSHPGHRFVAKHFETGERHSEFELTGESRQQFHIGAEEL